MISVLIASGHCFLREGIKRVLESSPEIKLVGESASYQEIICNLQKLRPDILLIDVRICCGKDGLELLNELKQISPQTKVLLFNGGLKDEDIFLALTKGARGYLQKGITPQDLIKAIQVIMKGEIWAESHIISKMLDEAASLFQGKKGKVKNTLFSILSQRECELVTLVADGCTNKEIASQLGISEQTVKCHLFNIFKKLNVKSRVLLTRYALKNGLITNGAH